MEHIGDDLLHQAAPAARLGFEVAFLSSFALTEKGHDVEVDEVLHGTTP